MSRPRLVQSSRLLSRATRSSNPTRSAFSSIPAISQAGKASPRCLFSACVPRSKGIMPDTDSPAKPESAESPITSKPVELSDSEYHDLADVWLENCLIRFEDLQDQGEDIDVEFSSGVMTIRTEEKGTYVLNKQPPNKQIWLSSPISGPKRYDWYIIGDGQNDKEGTAAGRWTYARDQSTLDQVIFEELGVDLDLPNQG